VIAVRVTIQHPMESGYRPDAMGRRLPRDIVQRFTCHYDGELVFAADLFPAIAANPYLAFHTVATQTGMLELRWSGDNGFSHAERVALTVT